MRTNTNASTSTSTSTSTNTSTSTSTNTNTSTSTHVRAWGGPAWVLVVAAVVAGGCERDPYQSVFMGDAMVPDMMQPDFCPPCTKSNNGVEICDQKDNDCDCQTDEGFNVNTDINHCGKCDSSCKLPGAITACEMGSCRFKGCEPGRYDLNNDLASGWNAKSDGCEYACTPTGAELCDGKDNDCNGKTDETFTLQNDVNNCGKCGNACQIANAVPKCVSGVCGVQSCKTGYIDKDKDPKNGCEEPCTVTGAEVCDGKDNDCNGVVDDPNGKVIDHQTDPDHCGGCNNVCALTNAYAKCVAAKCVFNGCKPGFINVDGNTQNGCECQPSNGGTEACDGKDNDCNGTTDVDTGGKALSQSCYTGPAATKGVSPCKDGTQVCNSGTWGPCQGEVKPKSEYCDSADTDCDGTADPQACVFAAAKRESRLDHLSTATLGSANSTQLQVAGSGDTMLAVWVDRRNNHSDIFGNKSTDGGKSWLSSDLSIALETANDKSQPRIALGGPTSAPARVYLAYERFTNPTSPSQPGVRNLYLRRSTDGGTTWGGPQAIKTDTTVDALYLRLGVVAGSSTDTVVVCWEQISVTGAVKPDLYCVRSTDSGANFSAAVQVNASGTDAIVPQLAVDASYAYVTWQEGQDIKLRSASLKASGFSFGSVVTLSSGDGQEPRILADGTGRVVVVWEDVSGTLVNLRANRSKDYGSTWLANDVRVDNDVVDGDSTNVALAARSGGRVFAAWEDTARGKRNVYVNYSDDTGATWNNPAALVPTATAGSTVSARPFVAVEPSGKNVYVAWEEARSSASNRDIYFSVSLDDGKTWNIPDYRLNEATAGTADAQDAQIRVGLSRVAVFWRDFRVVQSGSFTTGKNADIYCSYVQ